MLPFGHLNELRFPETFAEQRNQGRSCQGYALQKGTGKLLFMQIEKLSLSLPNLPFTIHINFHFPKPAPFSLLGFSSLLSNGILLEFRHQTVSMFTKSLFRLE